MSTSPKAGFSVAPISKFGREEKIDLKGESQYNFCTTDKFLKHSRGASPDFPAKDCSKK
jgi:hypothetical protein